MAVASAVTPALGGLAPPVLAVRSVSGAVFIAAGAVTWRRGAARPLGYLFVLAGCAMCLINLGLGQGSFATTLRIATGGYAIFGALLGHLLVSYPTGQLRTRLERFAVGYLYAVTAAYIAAQLTVGNSAGERYCRPDGCEDMFGVLISSDLAARMVSLGQLVLYTPAFALALAAVVRRWRAATSAGRRVLRPAAISLAAALGLGSTTVVIRGLGLDGDTTRVMIAMVWGVGVTGVAIGLLAGVLRSRLAMYGMGDLVTRLGQGESTAQIHTVLARLLGDPSVQLLLAAPDGRGFQDLTGTVVTAPGPGRAWLPVGEPAVGVIVHDDEVTPDPRIVQAAVGALRLLLDNLRLQGLLWAQLQEVQASRTRIVAAADAERRRIERNLHDGAQQHLVTSALSVRLARQRVRTAPEAAEELLGGAEQQLTTALEEIRQLARGLHPAILTDNGIGAAVDSLTQRLPLRVTVSDELGSRYPAGAETAAYFVVCEALANVTKHARVESAAVRLWQAPNALMIEVEDSGQGGTDPDLGSGLRGLSDRLATLGGTLTVTSGIGVGTKVRAEIPLNGPAGVRELM